MYPYRPPHISKPKECKRLYPVHLSEKEYFVVPKNLKLLAVPLFELYDNVQDDAHIICRESQIKDEVKDVLEYKPAVIVSCLKIRLSAKGFFSSISMLCHQT